MAYKVDAGTRVLKDPVTGRLQSVPADQAEQIGASDGLEYAGPDDIAAANKAEQYGTAGQAAQATAEEAVRTATFGAVPGFGSPEDIRGRQEQLQEEHPVVSALAQGAGAIVPAAAAAATGGALGAAAGLGEVAGGVLSAGLEGAATGAATEADQAYGDQRKFSVGNALMFGVGGEIVGRALPAALALGAGRIRRALSPLEAAAGEGLEEVGGESGARAMSRRAADAVELPPGPERTAAIRDTASVQLDNASEAIAGSLETAARAKETTTGELVHSALSDLLPEETPAQVRWATAQSEAAADARAQIVALGGDPQAESALRELEEGFDSTTDRGKWLSHGFSTNQELSKQIARDLPQPILDVLSEVQGRLNSGITDPSLWGDSAALIDDLQRASSSGLDGITAELGGGGYDATRVRGLLESGDPAARKTLEDAAESLENLSEVHRRYGTATDAEIERMRNSATQLREKMSLADEVNRVAPATAEPRAPSEPPDLETARRAVANQEQEEFRLRDLAGGTSKSKGAVQDFFDRLQEVANNGVKRTDFAKFEKSLSPEGLAYVQKTTGELATSAREVLGSLPKGSRPKLEGFIAKAENARSTSALDELKNALQSMRKKAAQQSSGSTEAQGIVDAIDSVEPKIRAALEDPKLVGTRVAKLQQTRNNFWANKETGYIRNSGQLKAAGYDLSDIVERDYDGRIVLQSDRRAIDKLINDPEHLTRPALDALDNMIASAQQMLKDTAASGAASSDRAVVGKFSESAAQLKEYVDGVRKLAAAKSVVERAGPDTGGLLSKGVGHALNAVAYGIHPALGYGVSVARHAAGSVNMASIQASAATLSKTTARVLAGVSKSRASAPLAGAALQRFAAGYATPEASFEAKKRVLMAVANDPTILADTIAASTGSLAETHPQLYAQMAGRISSGINYVANNLPPGIASSLLHPDGMPPARSALRDTAVLWNTVFHPETVYDDIQARLATSQQMRALESQHPDLYEQLKQDAVEQIGTNFRSVPHSTKAYVDILFDTDGMAGPMYSSYAAQQIGIAQSERQGQSGQSTLSSASGKAPGAPETSGVAAIKSSVTNRGTA